MGTFVNPGMGKFETAVNSEIYVDKSGILEYLNSVINTKSKYICVSRPRRFGKTTTADMVCAYYDSSVDSDKCRHIFENMRIAKVSSFEPNLNKYIVIHVNMADFFNDASKDESIIKDINEKIIDEIKELTCDKTFCGSLKEATYLLRKALDKQVVVVIDEWDCVFRNRPDITLLHKSYLDFLMVWLKDNENIALVYMTGILPIKKYGEHSALNMFDEFSMTDSGLLSEYVGFTDEEVKSLCSDYAMDFDKVKQWYDGYVLKYRSRIISNGKIIGWKDNTVNIYSPESVVDCLTKGTFKNYWNATETIEALKKPINRNEDGLNEIISILINGDRYKVNIRKYQNDMTSFASADDVLTMLIHLGYLAYDSESEEVFIPNKEIKDEYNNSVEKNEKWQRLFAVLNDSQKLLEATWREDESEVARMLEFAHDRASNKTYNSEAALSYAVQYAYYSAHNYYSTIQELDTGKGYADIVYIPAKEYPDKPALLVELKYNKDADTALDQIKRRNYPQILDDYKGNIILVGINYDSDIKNDVVNYKHHSCMIERV